MGYFKVFNEPTLKTHMKSTHQSYRKKEKSDRMKCKVFKVLFGQLYHCILAVATLFLSDLHRKRAHAARHVGQCYSSTSDAKSVP